MKSFELVRRYFSVLGISSLQRNQKSPFNTKNVFVLFQFILGELSSCLFILLEAQTFEEYANAFGMVLTLTIASFDFFICIWKSQQLFKFMKNFERMIEKSRSKLHCKFKLFHKHTN